MNYMCVINFNILFFIFLFVLKTSFGEECSSDGIKCINCNEYQNCNDGFPLSRIISCKNGDSCGDDHLKLCQTKLNCYAQNDCSQAGIFPDAMDDSKYYVCLNDASSGFLKYDFTCPEQNFFDKATLTCVARDVTLATTEVPSSSSVSTEPSTSSVSTEPSTSSVSTEPSSSSVSTEPSSSSVSTEPSSSSVSTEPSSSSVSTEPSSSSVSTEPSSSSTLTSSTSTSSTTLSTSTDPTSSTIPVTSTTPSPNTGPFECMASGIFPNPDNCKMYYRCSTSLKVFFYICPGNSYFNENILKCSMIISPKCQEQILKNSTSTLSPTTSALTTINPTTMSPVTTTITITTRAPTTPALTTINPTTMSSASTTITTITPAPPPKTTTFTSSTTTTTTTQTPTSTTTISSSSTPFSCPMTGIFADPLSCKTYYRCTLSGKIFQYICPGNTYFNEFTNRCGLIVTPRCRILIIQG